MEAHPRLLLAVLTIVSVSAAGCVGGLTEDVDPAGTGDAAMAAVGGITTDALEGLIAASTATPVMSLNNGGTFNFPIQPSGNVTGFVIELEWAATAPVNENLDLWVRDADAGAIPPGSPDDFPPAGPIAKATGPSVLRLAIAAEDFPDEEAYSILVRAASDMGAGAAAEQPFTLHVTTFTDVPFDAEYSALGGGEEEA